MTPRPLPEGRRTVTKRRVAWIAVFALLLVPTYVMKQRLEPTTAIEIVEAYLLAVADRDIDAALGYLDLQIVEDPPDSEGETAFSAWREEYNGAFYSAAIVLSESEASLLAPAAVDSEWRVVEVEELETYLLDEGRAEVEATIAHPGGTATGTFDVDVDRRKVLNGLGRVAFAPSAFTYVTVNGAAFDQGPWAAQWDPKYALFPGVYRFPGAADPVAVMGDDLPGVVPPPEPVLDEDVRAAVQAALESYIDECAAALVQVPPGCPFGTDGEIDSASNGRVHPEHSLAWEVLEYPRAVLRVGDTASDDGSALLIDLEAEGLIELSGTGEDQQEALVEFTARCHFDAAYLIAYLNADGTAEVRWNAAAAEYNYSEYDFDTCRGTA
jgi:hypothetical protein